MRAVRFWAAISVLILLSGCYSGISKVSVGDGVESTFEELDAFDGNGGSLSTVWYRGSDPEFHYFAHFAKISTNYKVKRGELDVSYEFPLGSERSVHVVFELIEGEKIAISYGVYRPQRYRLRSSSSGLQEEIQEERLRFLLDSKMPSVQLVEVPLDQVLSSLSPLYYEDPPEGEFRGRYEFRDPDGIFVESMPRLSLKGRFLSQAEIIDRICAMTGCVWSIGRDVYVEPLETYAH